MDHCETSFPKIKYDIFGWLHNWEWTIIDQSAIAIGPYPGKNMRRFLIGRR
jgi:hypothetical protein